MTTIEKHTSSKKVFLGAVVAIVIFLVIGLVSSVSLKPTPPTTTNPHTKAYVKWLSNISPRTLVVFKLVTRAENAFSKNNPTRATNSFKLLLDEAVKIGALDNSPDTITNSDVANFSLAVHTTATDGISVASGTGSLATLQQDIVMLNQEATLLAKDIVRLNKIYK
jgi:hypothetical protein